MQLCLKMCMQLTSDVKAEFTDESSPHLAQADFSFYK